MLQLLTLGELRLRGASEAGLSSRRKELTLLCYLARHTRRPLSRADLAELLWGDRNSTKARQSLRQALSELKRIVGDGLEAGPDRVSLQPGAVLLDASVFEQELAQGLWLDAVQRWGGDFLSGLDDTGGEEFRSWLEAEREGLRRGLRLGLSHLVEEAHQTGHWSQGIAWAERWVDLLPYDEEAHRRLIELTHLSGNNAAALVRFAASRQRLNEIGLTPSTALVQLGQLLERDSSRVRRSTPGSAALFTPDLVGRGRPLAELMSLWKDAIGGRACAVLVEGEAGIGKSRLCEEFLRLLGQERIAPFVVRARAHETVETVPLMLLQEAVTSLAGAPGLVGASPRALAELARISPLLRDRFSGLPEPAGTHSALEEALLEALVVLSDERPVVFHIENVSRADSSSQRLLRSLVARGSGRLLFLLTARTGDGDVSSAFTELASEFHIRRLKLQALTASTASGAAALHPERWQPVLHHRADCCDGG
jgi:DNA-binding SARP family transcriptional activator